ncbi:MAG: type II secretion system F family protein [Candidatus Pacearchaeota archaeon]|nr:type II secretion system F family protein [Candidatus Pacearchaeota archaeon]
MNESMEYLKENVKKEESISNDVTALLEAYHSASQDERKFLESSFKSYFGQLEIINNSILEMSNDISFDSKNSDRKNKEKYKRIITSRGSVFVNKEDRSRYLDELKIADVKKSVKTGSSRAMNRAEEDKVEIRNPSQFVIFSNKVFKKSAKNLSENFSFLDKNLKQAGMPFILTSYISLMLFLTISILIVSVILALVLSLGGSFLTISRNVLISLIIPALLFVFLLAYPNLQAQGNSKKLESEMPFALSHMAAIASSKIEPSKMFGIMAESKEYPMFSSQMKKIKNQMDIYGYDLTTALRNVSKLSVNRKFSELLNGISTIIISGGDLLVYLKEKSKDVLLDYKLSREKYSNIIGMYSDIYTALLIVAPLILMLVLSFMGSVGASFAGLSVPFLANLGIVAIVVLNILFILFLQITQPEI